MDSLTLTDFALWKIKQCRSAAKKVKGNKFSKPLTDEEITALAIMADCDMEEIESTDEDGDECSEWKPKWPLFITVEDGRINVREDKPSENEQSGF
jgi:hypothetical protein